MDTIATPPIPLAEALGPARERTAEFLRALDPAGRVVVFCHFDADGLAAGALFGRGLRRMGFGDVQVVHSDRGENAFSEVARRRLAALRPAALIVTDLGVGAAGVLPGVPTLYVDHHRPDGEPADATVVLGYGWEPIPPPLGSRTSCCRRWRTSLTWTGSRPSAPSATWATRRRGMRSPASANAGRQSGCARPCRW